MEAVPRMSMISCELKISPTNTELGLLLKYIRDFYVEDPESYKKEIKEIETLRQTAIKPPRDYTGCSILKRYFAQLHFLQSRFPMSDEGDACVPFTWTDIYSQVVYSITDIEYEQACILYNIGALHSELGAADARANTEGMKIACTHFQCAAWAFQHLRDTYPQPKGSDMSHDLLTFFIDVMLAQAQECILEKSMLDSRKSSITSKVAAQVVVYCKKAIGALASRSSDSGCIADVVGSKTAKEWKKFLDLKVVYYQSIASLFMGNQAEEQQKMGERVVWYHSAYNSLNDAIRLAKTMDKAELNEALAFTMDVVGGKYTNAKKENEFVYHEKVPAMDSLPELQCASLVKGIPFSHTDPDVCGPDIFARLIPMEAHKHSSMYSEEKAKILRSMCSKVEDKDKELKTYLSSLQLDTENFSLESEPVPEELVERCAAASVKPNAVSEVNAMMKELLDISESVKGSLRQCHELLVEDEQIEKKHQETYGTRSRSLIILELNKEFSKYQDASIKADKNNDKLKDKVKRHTNCVKYLSKPLDEIEKGLPSVTSLRSSVHEKNYDNFHMLLTKANEMQDQRSSLMQQLRDVLQKDDITEIIVTQMQKEDIKKIFKEELRKHDRLLLYMEKNLSAQENVLYAITQANATYAETRKAVMKIKNERQSMVQTIVNSFDLYEEIKQQREKGLEFYQKLQANVARLAARLRSVVDVQNEERYQVAEAQAAKNKKSLNKLKSSTADTPQPKLRDYLSTVIAESESLSVKDVNSQQVAKELCTAPYKYLPGVESSAEPTDFPSCESDVNINHPMPMKYRNESRLSSVPPQEGTPLVQDNFVEPLYSNQYWNSSGTAKGLNPAIAAFGFDSTFSKAGSVPQSKKFSAAVARPTPTDVTVRMATTTGVNPILTEPNYAAFYSVSYPTVTVNSSSVYSSSLPSYTSSPSLPLTSSGNVPYSQLTKVTLFDNYRSIPTSVGISYMTSGVPDSNAFRSSSFDTSSSHSSQKAFPNIYTDPNLMSYETFNSVPVHGSSSSAPYSYSSHSSSSYSYSSHSSSSYSSVPSSSYSTVTSASHRYRNLVSGPVTTSRISRAFPPTHSTVRPSTYKTSASDYSYSVPSYSQMGPVSSYSQQYPSMMPLSPSYPPPGHHQSLCSGHSHSMMPLSSTGYPFTLQHQPESSQVPLGVMPPFSVNHPSPFQYQAESSSQSPGVMPLTSKGCFPSVQQNQPQSTSPMIQPNQLTNVPEPHYQMPWIQAAQNLSYSAQPTIAETGQVPPGTTDPPLEFHLQNPDPLTYVSVPVVEQTKIDPILPKPATESHVETKKVKKLPLSKGLFPSKDSDLLSETIPQQKEPKVLQPKIVDIDTKLTSESKERDKGTFLKDPLDDLTVQEKFITDVEKYEKFVDGLVRKSLNGTTPLDQKWKEFTDAQDKESRKMSISIARCYPMKNRFSDIMPYDSNRIKLTTMKDDYINASFLTDFLPSCPIFINTQAPLPATFIDFWAMIWEQQVETLVCLMSSSELKNHLYFPTEKGESMQFGVFNVTLQNEQEKVSSIEYRFSLTHSKNTISRVVILLQFMAWPSSGVPSTPSQFLQFVTEVLNYYKQQRSLLRPVVVHCSAGVGRSGVFCVVCAMVMDMRYGHGPSDIVQVATRMSQKRKYLIQEKDQLKFCYDAVLYYAQDLLMKRGILTNRASFDDKLPGSSGTTSHSRHPSEDFILGSGGLAKLQSGIAKMGLSDQSYSDTGNISPSKELEHLSDLSLTQDNRGPSEVKDVVKPPTCVFSGVSELLSITPKDVQSEMENEPNVASNVSNLPIIDLLDPSHFTLETGSPVKRKITKESFLSPAGGLTNPATDRADPLSQLDPLWSLKKSKS